MDFIQHSINWCKGEIIESSSFGFIGILVVVIGILFWKLGDTPNSKVLVLPLVIVGLFFAVMGTVGVYSNKSRIPKYEERWQQNPTAFVQAEKERVEGFDNIFKYSYPAAFILVIGGAILFFVFNSPSLKAISMALILVGLFGYFIDFFAAERAKFYLKEILKELKL